MSAADVIAEAVDAHDWMQPRGYAWPVCACGREFKGGSDEAAAHQAQRVLAALSAAGYVVATPEEIRAWPVEQVAELIGGSVEDSSLKAYDYDPQTGEASNFRPHKQRPAGPWREVRDV
ncbi:MAG TPA: hypothetical protein VHO27_01500 [Angustibacter sp.]|nr:hypothetical protein [Angustibacter sp.]